MGVSRSVGAQAAPTSFVLRGDEASTLTDFWKFAGLIAAGIDSTECGIREIIQTTTGVSCKTERYLTARDLVYENFELFDWSGNGTDSPL